MKSLVFVPSIPKMLNKISAMDADAYIIDLEDSINETEKAQALDAAYEFLTLRQDNSRIFVRLAGNHLEDELDRLSHCSFLGYMIPKFERPEDYDRYNRYFSDKVIMALVETPVGIVNLKEIAGHPMVSMLAFGAEDFTSLVGMKNAPEYLNYARSKIVTYGKAFKKPTFDTPSFVIDDTETLKNDIQTAVDFGFDGKLAIHPKQIALINEMFRYYDLDNIRTIVKQYEETNAAVLRIGNNVYEKMHIAHYKRILKEHGID